MMSVKRHPPTTQISHNMIYKNGKELTARYIGTRAIAAVYHGASLVWQTISSCFGSGAWLGDRPWSGTDGWKGNTK